MLILSVILIIIHKKSVVNTYPTPDWQSGFVEWDEGLSGEATYICRLPKLENGDYRLNLGEVRHCAKVYLNGVESLADLSFTAEIVSVGPNGTSVIKSSVPL